MEIEIGDGPFIDVEKLWGGGWWWWVYLDYSVSSGRFFDHELNLTRTMDQDQDQSLTIKFSEKVQIFHKDQLVLGSLIIN